MATPEQAAGLERLTAMLLEAQRGELDLGTVGLADVSRHLGDEVRAGDGELDLLWAAESLQVLARLLEIKMGRHLEDATEAALTSESEAVEVADPGARLAEYRLFKAAAGVLLTDSSAGPKALEDNINAFAVDRSFTGNQLEMLFHDPPGNIPSPTPKATRIPSILVKPLTIPVKAVKNDHHTMAAVMIFLAPNLSARIPPGIWQVA